jgi:EAL domain-containing protein (putative c-di-GMP-specific phosphodiesterase class I)
MIWKFFRGVSGRPAQHLPPSSTRQDRVPFWLADHGAALVRRIEILSVAIAILFPVGYLIDDLISGRAPPYNAYLPATAILLAILLLAFRYAPARIVAIVLIATVYVGLALTPLMPHARAVYIVIFVAAVPFFYLIGGIRLGRAACLGFIALIIALIASGILGSIRELRGIVRPYHYAMILASLLIQVVVAEGNERRHTKELDVIFNEHFRDGATNLPNATALAAESLGGGEILMLVRLRNFRDLRSFFDDAEGRAMAVKASRILRDFASSMGTRGPYRISESEFALIYPSGVEPRDASSAILGAFAGESVTEGSPLRFEIQIGSYRASGEGESAFEAVEQAETALADCVAADSVASFRERGTNGSREDDLKALAPVLVKNIVNRSLSAVFQPVYDVRHDGIGFLEALTRLRVDDGFASPEAYLSVTNRLGLEKHFGDFIVEAALDMALRSGHSVSLNITFRDLERPYFIDALFKAYASLSGRHNTLIVELTEQAAFSDYGRLRSFAAEVHEAGGLVILDDFGTGYSNYASLLEARFDAIKVAGEIVREIVARREAAELYFGLCAFCRASGLDVVAEHISDDGIMKKALEGGVALLQGYYFSSPLTADRILDGALEFPDGRSASPAPLRRPEANFRG